MRITSENFKNHLVESHSGDEEARIKEVLDIARGVRHIVRSRHDLYSIEKLFGVSHEYTEILRKAPKVAQSKILASIKGVIYFDHFRSFLKISESLSYSSQIYKSSSLRFLIDYHYKPLINSEFNRNVQLSRSIYNKIISSQNGSGIGLTETIINEIAPESRQELDKNKILTTSLLMMVENFGSKIVTETVDRLITEEFRVTINNIFLVASDYEHNKDFPLEWIIT